MILNAMEALRQTKTYRIDTETKKKESILRFLIEIVEPAILHAVKEGKTYCIITRTDTIDLTIISQLLQELQYVTQFDIDGSLHISWFDIKKGVRNATKVIKKHQKQYGYTLCSIYHYSESDYISFIDKLKYCHKKEGISS